MDLRRLKWLTIVLPIAFLVATQVGTVLFAEPWLGGTTGHALAIGIVTVGVVIFSSVVFRIIGRMQRRIVRQNEELTALNAVGRAVSGSLDLREAMTRALRNVMEVTGARAGEIIVESEEPEERPLRFSLGTAADLSQLILLRRRHTPQPPQEVETVELGRLDSGLAAGAPATGLSTYASVPLRTPARRLARMTLLAGDHSHLASEGSERLLAAMGNQIAVAVQASRLFENVVRGHRETQALFEIGLKITSLQDTAQILRSIVEHTRELLGSETAALCLARGGNGGLILADCAGDRASFRRAPAAVSTLPLPLAVLPDDFTEPEPGAPCFALADGHHECRLAARLIVGDMAIGELCVSGSTPRRFSERQRELLAGLADMAAIAINNARLLERERYVAVLEERERLAREMHDSLAQVLAYLHLQAQTTKRALASGDPARAESELAEMASLAHEAYIDVREAILGLRERVSPGIGIVDTLREYVEKFCRQAGVNAELQVIGPEVPLSSPEAEVQLVRVVQEALTNVRKHAAADRAWVRLESRNDSLCITVEDRGCGFDPSLILAKDGPRFGVRTMRERIERVGGKLEIESRPGEGTAVRIHLPLAKGEDSEPDKGTSGGRPAALPEGSSRPV